MQITNDQLKALELAHDAVRALTVVTHIQPLDKAISLDEALDTLTAAIEALKEGK